jgi:hypothetical protein
MFGSRVVILGLSPIFIGGLSQEANMYSKGKR